MVVKVYYSSVSSSKEIKKHQQAVFMVLEAKKIEFERIDISIDEESKNFMWSNSKQPESGKPLPPQIFSDDEYCGNFDDFDEATETKKLRRFLRLPNPEPEEEENAEQQ
ncbi:SH3 domain-binding glutamic acid-rich-like protein 2 [Ptychodera flava]|uniref:SH3 domain-binding glutamic acid-rich-like protein 2 n=1 Tax=Ptychodera flava TaxID=63121 RepID=UPI00396AA66D